MCIEALKEKLAWAINTIDEGHFVYHIHICIIIPAEKLWSVEHFYCTQMFIDQSKSFQLPENMKLFPAGTFLFTVSDSSLFVT